MRAFPRKSRSIRMEGKAFFDVARNEDVPFEITLSNAFVKVLGTSFQVEETPSGTDVYVRSGKVFFASAPDAEGLVLTQGMEAVLGKEGGLPQPVTEVAPNPAAWATGVFEYESTPLEDVLAELSAFYGVPLSVSGSGLVSGSASDSPSAPERRLTARFRTTDPLDRILSLISAATGAEISR